MEYEYEMNTINMCFHHYWKRIEIQIDVFIVFFIAI